MSCPYTFAQNGKAEHIIRSTNNMVCSLLFQASMRSPIGMTLCTLPPTSSTSYQPKLCTSRHRTLPCLALRPCTTTSACLVARVIPTHPPPHRISLPLGRLSVCFSNTPRIIKGTGVLIALAIGLSSLVMSRSMSPIFPLLLPSPHHRSPRILSF
jgi:hypothetical protein